MPRRPRARSQARAKPAATPGQARVKARPGLGRITGRRRTLAVAAALLLLLSPILIGWLWIGDSAKRLRENAEAAARAGDWIAALRVWRSLNATRAAESQSHLGEARACLALSRAAQAERGLRRAIAANPAEPEPWRLLLKILRVEDRSLEAQRLGWEAYDRVHPEARRDLLGELTLALLADLPDELARGTLGRWVEADREDVDARVALLQRIAAQPRASDPDRMSLLDSMESLLARHPDHVVAREALVAALADAGEPARGRALLDDWPQSARDARYWRLRGRWELEYDHQTDRAAKSFQIALAELPHDWRSWYRLARAWRILGRDLDGKQAAETVSRIREVLDPLTLGPQLETDFDHLDSPASLSNLAALSDRAGLSRLADAWRTEAQVQTIKPSAPAP